MPVVVSGEMPLAFPPIAPSPPNLFAAEYVRTDSGFGLSLPLLLVLDVDKESLLVLRGAVSQSYLRTEIVEHVLGAALP